MAPNFLHGQADTRRKSSYAIKFTESMTVIASSPEFSDLLEAISPSIERILVQVASDIP
ncbi:hypothetical protein P175DRAFT_0504683 [Aspergillus ochraceoroseus IBT 24754]|uniref:Uncharacterized protein n=1 Tax=Aspergillus ochraceoroseus IBT 24754 TaxID=1392256 RepID=A0A2T5LNT3_9EURO|nr:uncharacterized protein P175DRAFT_0504683 [Aspergillus ochraceoroseus IBT 24754]PTU17941.1 hypothetical protein P175DRAFT_0504683 [Aspergillus ochraceoroseus IBT 24754]